MIFKNKKLKIFYLKIELEKKKRKERNDILKNKIKNYSFNGSKERNRILIFFKKNKLIKF